MQFIRRASLLSKDGTSVEVPAISGNSLRGQLRRIAARQMLDRLKLERVPTKVYHLLFSGGAISKGETSSSHRVADIRALRELVPMIGLFGGAWHAEIMPGCLSVDWIWPVCEATIQITGIESPVSVRELVDDLFYTRCDDSPIPDDEVSSQMIYECEAIVPGVVLCGALSLTRATEVESGCLAIAFAEWLAYPRLGGQSSRGHGRLEVLRWPELIGFKEEYVAHLDKHRDTLRSWLTVAE